MAIDVSSWYIVSEVAPYLVISIQVFAISFVFYLVGWSFDALILFFSDKNFQ